MPMPIGCPCPSGTHAHRVRRLGIGESRGISIFSQDFQEQEKMSNWLSFRDSMYQSSQAPAANPKQLTCLKSGGFTCMELISLRRPMNKMFGTNEAILNNLSLGTEMTKHIQVRASQNATSADELGRFSPLFVWLLQMNKLRPKFQAGLDALTKYILDGARPQQLRSIILTGPMFASLTQSFLDAINSGANVEENECRPACEVPVGTYTNAFDKMFLPEEVNSGVVVATGPGAKMKDGMLILCDVKKSNTVLLPEYGGTPVKLEGQEGNEFLLYRNDDLLGVLGD